MLSINIVSYWFDAQIAYSTWFCPTKCRETIQSTASCASLRYLRREKKKKKTTECTRTRALMTFAALFALACKHAKLALATVTAGTHRTHQQYTSTKEINRSSGMRRQRGSRVPSRAFDKTRARKSDGGGVQ